MPRPSSASIYRTNGAQTAEPDPMALDAMMDAVEACTTRLQKQPYDAQIWTERAGLFLSLNYPELAVGDAYKATLLFDRTSRDAIEVDGDSNVQNDLDKVQIQAYGILGKALYDCHCHWEAAEFWEEVSNKVPGGYAKGRAEELRALLKRKKEAAAGLRETPQEQTDLLRDGGVVTVRYPWMEERHRTRSSETVALVNDELKHNVEPQACYLARSTLSQKDDMLGMFAARDIEQGECILVDRSATGICSDPGGFSCGNCYGRVKCPPLQSFCCSKIPDDSPHAAHAAAKASNLLVYCSTACHDLAMRTYHKAMCGQDFSWLLEPAQGLQVNASPLRPLLMLRFLASCVQAGVDKHPLDHPLIARLQPLADCGHLDAFTFTESVKIPIRILQQLGVDVFANLNFDTMTLHSIWTRIANNKAGSPDPKRGFIDEITPLLPLFNHSCEPNVEYKREDSSTTIRFTAKKRIAKDEEIFDSYLDVEGMALQQRVESLWPWLEGGCLCPKCRRETEGR